MVDIKEENEDGNSQQQQTEEIILQPGKPLSVNNDNHKLFQIVESEQQQVELRDSGTVKRTILSKSDFNKMAKATEVTHQAGVKTTKIERSEMGSREKLMNNCCLKTCCCFFPQSGKIVVNEGNRAIQFRYGRINKRGASGPGRYSLYKDIDDIRMVNIQDTLEKLDIPEMFTIEQISVTVNSILIYQIVDPIKAVLNVKDVEDSMKIMAASIIRDKIGTNTLGDITKNKDAYQQSIEKELAEITIIWGVRVLRVELRDFKVVRNILMLVETEKPAIKQQPAVTQQPKYQINVSIDS